MNLSVVLVSHGFQPSYEKGFANGLAANGITVELVASDRTLIDSLDSRVCVNNLRGSQDSKRSVIEKLANLARYALALITRVRRGRHEIIHLTGLFMTRSQLLGLFEWLIYRASTRRFVMTVHNLLPHNQHTPFNEWICRIIYRLPDRLVVHTDKMKFGLIERFGVTPERVVVMQHGVDEIPPTFNEPAPSNVLRILIFGGLSPYKGVDLLLHALSDLKDLKIDLVMAGECRDMAYQRKIAQILSTFGPLHSVRWEKRFIPESEVAEFFESADVVALPYRHIDQSGVLFTAYRFGTPVLATDVGVFREYLPDFAGVLVPEASTNALALGLREFAARKHQFDRQRIREYARTMTWSHTVRPLIDVYRELFGVR